MYGIIKPVNSLQTFDYTDSNSNSSDSTENYSDPTENSSDSTENYDNSTENTVVSTSETSSTKPTQPPPNENKYTPYIIAGSIILATLVLITISFFVYKYIHKKKLKSYFITDNIDMKFTKSF